MPRTSRHNRQSRSRALVKKPKTRKGMNEFQKRAFDKRKRRQERRLWVEQHIINRRHDREMVMEAGWPFRTRRPWWR